MYKSFFENRLDKIEIVSTDSVKPSANQKHDKTFKEIYFLIEHQSTVDKRMPDRILEYCMETMREIKENRKGKTNPLIVPIVIYTGTRKWTVATDFSDTQKVEERYKEYKITQFLRNQ